MVTIRPYEPADRKDLYAVCLGTGADGEDATGLYEDAEILGHVYVGPYLELCPELAWVAMDADGIAKGYVLAAPDTALFEARCEAQWWPALRERYPRGGFPTGSLEAELEAIIHEPRPTPATLLEKFPAHLHIDLLPPIQGKGRGQSMMGLILAELAAAGVRGVHLGVSPRNTRAVGFYSRLGFAEIPEVSDDGELVMGKRL